MSLFLPAFQYLLPHEGGYVDDPNDHGGATKFGISLYWLQQQGLHADTDINHDGRIDINDIKTLAPENAAHLYESYWWDYYHIDRIEAQPVASKLLDHMVNMGGIPATRNLQLAVGLVGVPVACDGLLGPVTIHAINDIHDTKSLLTAYCDRLVADYQSIVAHHPEDSKYLNGWKRRALCLPEPFAHAATA